MDEQGSSLFVNDRRQTMPGALSSVADNSIDGSENLLTKKEDLMVTLDPNRDWKYSMTVDLNPEVTRFSALFCFVWYGMVCTYPPLCVAAAIRRDAYAWLV